MQKMARASGGEIQRLLLLFRVQRLETMKFFVNNVKFFKLNLLKNWSLNLDYLTPKNDSFFKTTKNP